MGIFFNNKIVNEGGHVIRDNIIRGNFRDGIGGTPNGEPEGTLHANSFIYRNEIKWADDDAIEIEGASINCAVWGNTIVEPWHMAFGVSPVQVGPLYIFRNVAVDWHDAAVKMGGNSDGYVYIFHNTFRTSLNTSVAADFGHTDIVDNFTYRNNIFAVGKYAIHQRHDDTTNTYDYDNSWKGGWAELFRWGPAWPEDIYDTLEEFQAVSASRGNPQEVHGISGPMRFVNDAAMDFRLQPDSSNIDRGVVLPGFNDENSPWPYQGSAPDIGAYEYDSGEVINRPPVLNAIGDKSVHEGELLEFTISASDPDGDPLTYSASNLPSGASFDAQTRTFSWTPGSGQAGSYPNVHFAVSDGELTDSEDITITVNAAGTAPSLPLRVNAGGDMYTDSLGNSWEADQAYVSGGWGFHGDDNTVDRGTGHAISGTEDDRIYQTERYGLSGYRFDIGNGTYDVTLHFAETYKTGPGQRVFDVSIEGQLVLNDLDIYSEVGYSTALKKVFSGIVVQDGQLNLDFASSVEEPEINGMEIFTAGAGPNNPPVLNPIGDKSVHEGELLEFTISASDPDSDPLTYSASNLPSGASFDAQTRTFSWTPGSGQAGSYPSVHFEVSDGELTDSEDITITVSTASSGGGGGGASDRTPPRVYDILTSEATKTSATITWRTHEMSTSQVEYWASPGKLSPLDERRVLNHIVYLTDLSPATTYHYKIMSKDSAGNLAVSDEYTLTTLGVPATFTVNSLEITPTEVDIGEEVTISVLVTNTGDATGSYEVTLKTDDVVIATEEVIDLAGGASQKVTFTTASDSAGVLVVDVSGITGSFVVRGVLAPEIGVFNVTPSYDMETQKLTFARVIYRVDIYQPMADVELVLKVSLDGEPVEEVSLLSSSELGVGEANGSADYLPPQGWRSGTYTFQGELYAGGEFYTSTTEQELEVAVESATTVVSWAILAQIIGVTLIAIVVTTFVVLRRKRYMLRA